MGTPTWTPLATTTLGSSASSVTFSNIPNTYRDLILIYAGISANDDRALYLRFNADSGSNYSQVFMLGNGSTTSSGSASGTNIYVGEAWTTQTNTIIQIQDSSATDKHKTVLSRSNASAFRTVAVAGRWANTNAITSLNISIGSSTFNSGSTFALFGVIA